MIHNPILSEDDGWFWLRYMQDSDSDGLGIGGSQCTTRFQTNAERSYFMMVEELRDQIGRLAREVAFLKTVKGANANVIAVRAAARVARAERKAYRESVGL